MVRPKLTPPFPGHATAEELKTHFKRFGAIRDAVVLVDRVTGRSRGFGFVQLEDSRCCDAVLRGDEACLCSRFAAAPDAKRAAWHARHRHARGGRAPGVCVPPARERCLGATAGGTGSNYL